MPSFKPKSSKKIKVFNTSNKSTLDETHQNHAQHFTTIDTDTIPALLKEKETIIDKLKTQSGNLNIDDFLEMKDRLKEIKKLLKSLNNEKNKYYLDNSSYIFEYFETKQNINDKSAEQSSSSSSDISVSQLEIGNNTKNQLICNIFKLNKTKDEQKQTTTVDNINKSANIVHKYMTNVDENFLDMDNYVKETDVCQKCHKGEMIPMEDEGILICNMCSIQIAYLIVNEKPSYKEPPKEVCFYAYKKINHFKEILSQFQGKETTQIPDKVISDIKQQMKKERINLEHMTYSKTKEMLKKLGYNKYYEHIAYIKNRLGIPPPIFTQQFEETLCNLFMDIQVPYAQSCPDYRVNFLNYYYVLLKFCELLKKTEYIKDIPRLKDREKILDQDQTWKEICAKLNWHFIPTV